MLASVRTFAVVGIEARDVRVEVDVRKGLPSFTLVGLPDAAVRESRERVRAALENSGFRFPRQRITVNLAPANLPKAGPGFDLAIAAALLVASEQLPRSSLEGVALAGEVALDGSLRAAPGALPMAERARSLLLPALAVPAASAAEAALANLAAANGGGPLPRLRVLPLDRLRQLATLGERGEPAAAPEPDLVEAAAGAPLPDLADLRGQGLLRRGLEIAAAGGHSLLMTGPPGAGKSLAATRLPSILPPLTVEEAIEVMRIASATGRTIPLARARVAPFRAPHHTISSSGLVGGGSPLRPGEVTLAHRGVLFLDEFAEFRRDAVEALRQPLEEGWVQITRVHGSVRLPCRFMLVAAANPCPCGGGARPDDCDCPASAVRRYRARVRGAIADRMDIWLAVSQPTRDEMDAGPGEPSAAVRERVATARERQAARLGPGRCNAEMSPAETRRHVRLGGDAKLLLGQGHRRFALSGRGYDRVLRLARTLADLAGRQRVGSDHVGEALSLRRREGD